MNKTIVTIGFFLGAVLWGIGECFAQSTTPQAAKRLEGQGPQAPAGTGAQVLGRNTDPMVELGQRIVALGNTSGATSRATNLEPLANTGNPLSTSVGLHRSTHPQSTTPVLAAEPPPESSTATSEQ